MELLREFAAVLVGLIKGILLVMLIGAISFTVFSTYMRLRGDTHKESH